MKKHGIEKHINNVKDMKILLENGSDGSGCDLDEKKGAGNLGINRSFGSDDLSEKKSKIRTVVIDKSKIKPVKKEEAKILFPF